jgi:hypothetical protein
MQRTLLFLALISAAGLSHATSYTYQGSLADRGKPAEGLYDLRLTVLDASGKVPMAAPLTLHAVRVNKGNFSTDLDFGQEFTNPEQLKLSVEVQAGNEGFVKLGETTSLIPSSPGGVCWETGGNSTSVPNGFNALGTNLPGDPELLALKARGDEILYLRGSSAAVEQNNSTANGSGAAAWNNSTAAGNMSFTAGTGSTAPGAINSVVFADGTAGAFQSTLPNQFMVRADGGVYLNVTSTSLSGADLVIGTRPIGGDVDSDLVWDTRSHKAGRLYLTDLNGNFFMSTANLTGPTFLMTTANGASLTAGGTWTNGSSRAFKQAFINIDAGEILAKVIGLPISTWDYKNSSEGRHVGPMAEDFSAAFGLGTDAQHISTVDADGIALAAIQGLNQKLESENAALKARLDALEARLDLR